MEAYELDKIKVLATSFRGAIEIAKDADEFDNDFAFPRFPKGCCGDTSDIWHSMIFTHIMSVVKKVPNHTHGWFL